MWVQGWLLSSQVLHAVIFNGVAYTQGVVAFFHPNASGGGGGERVLWCVDPSGCFLLCSSLLYKQGESEI